MIPKTAEVPPEIDGILDDAVWKDAINISGLKTYDPDFGGDMEFETKVYMAYDKENLYFAFRCYDDPNLIKTSISARDKIEDDDWVCINLDAYNDNQSINGFFVNPNGIQMDARYSGHRNDTGIDFVWYSAGKIDQEGYSVEIKIPFKSLRYANKGDKVNMGVVFERKITRNSTRGTYPAMDPTLGRNFMIQTMVLEYSGVPKNTLLEVLPSVTYSKNKWTEEGVRAVQKGVTEFGVTGKWGITSDLALDVTYNPDFSQIESDVGQIDNNQRFALFYPERRPFFQEGSENFDFTGRFGREGLRSLVHTRTIVNPILATKLSGKVGAKSRIAAIYARDELYPDDGDSLSNPFANVGVMRYRRSFNDDSYIGGVYTGRFDNGAINQLMGGDGLWRLSNTSTIGGHYFGTHSRDSLEGPMTNDHSMATEYSYNSRRLRISARIFDFSENFGTDVGYVGRVGVTKYNLFLNPRFYFDTKVLKRIENWISLSQTIDKPSGLWEKSYYINTRAMLIRNTEISIAYNPRDEIYEGLKFNTNNMRAQVQTQVHKRVNIQVELRYGNLIRYVDDPYSGRGKTIEGQLNLQLSDKINSQWMASYSDFYRTSDGMLDFDRTIVRSKNTYQVNKYFFLRTIFQYDSRTPEISADFLASFTFIPGTVVHVGYGSLMNKLEWDPITEDYVSDRREYSTFNNGLFFKASYLWRK